MKKLTKKQAVDNSGRVWSDATIKELVSTNDRAALRALDLIWKRQTLDEKQHQITMHHNEIGFTSADATILTDIHAFWTRNNYVTEKQMKLIKKKMPKYWAQILDDMRARFSQKTEQLELVYVEPKRNKK